MPPRRKERRFILVRWLQDETVGVVPQSTVHKDDQRRVYVGSSLRVKYGRKFYEGEILQMSGNCHFLIAACGYSDVVILHAHIS